MTEAPSSSAPSEPDGPGADGPKPPPDNTWLATSEVREASLPSAATEPGRFDRFASSVASVVARAWFFLACVVLVVVWVPSYLFLANVDTWQLIINTATTIVTFLLVALLQNTSHRHDAALQRKLNAIAEALADLMEASTDVDMPAHVAELRAAVGLEQREGT